MKQERKIGSVIIVNKDHNNYGTSLQGFATVKTAQRLGYDLRIIRYEKRRTLKELLLTLPLLILSGALQPIKRRRKSKKNKIKYPDYAKNNEIRTKKVNEFKLKQFDSISDYYVGFDNLSEGSKNYNVIFVGSDQIWSPLSLYARFYNLLFVHPSIPRFSYASSFGVSNILPWQRQKTAEFLNRLNAIGVREIRGKEIVDSLSSNKAKIVLDPTLLLTGEEWKQYSNESSVHIDEPYIFAYILGKRSDIREQVLKLKEQTGYKIVSMNHVDEYLSEDDGFGDITPYDIDAFDFIKLLSNANYVCTDSFHGTIFSLLFHKQFVTFYRHQEKSAKSTESRIDSILKIFSCESRLFNFGKHDIKTVIDQPIDYTYFEQELTKLRTESLDFLQTGLDLSNKQANS